MSRLTQDGTAEPVSRDQILRRERGQGNINFPSSADHEQDWQPYPVDPSLAICDDHTYVHYDQYVDGYGASVRYCLLVSILHLCQSSDGGGEQLPVRFNGPREGVESLLGGVRMTQSGVKSSTLYTIIK